MAGGERKPPGKPNEIRDKTQHSYRFSLQPIDIPVIGDPPSPDWLVGLGEGWKQPSQRSPLRVQVVSLSSDTA